MYISIFLIKKSILEFYLKMDQFEMDANKYTDL